LNRLMLIFCPAAPNVRINDTINVKVSFCIKYC